MSHDVHATSAGAESTQDSIQDPNAAAASAKVPMQVEMAFSSEEDDAGVPSSAARVPVEVVFTDDAEQPEDPAAVSTVIEEVQAAALATDEPTRKPITVDNVAPPTEPQIESSERQVSEVEEAQAQATEKPPTKITAKVKDTPAKVEVSKVKTFDENLSETATDLFSEMGLSPDVLTAITTAGYDTPSPIQSETVPFILEGRDLMGQAETGSGKTAAFAWPLLSKIDVKIKKPQVLVLAPTRELAIQVTDAFNKYARSMAGFRAVTIYGGQSYETQLRALDRGVQVVVGTPGRVMDHLRRETLDLSELKTLVLDEADEMLRMGFIDDVEWILEQTPAGRQILSFSATLPEPIRRIAKKYLNNPASVAIRSNTATADSIEQSCIFLQPREKIQTLIRLLETEETEGVIVFVKTRSTTIQVAESLIQKGMIASPLNGDIPQAQRERTVNQLKSGRINIVVATDVAARGLDVQRISHVINYDFPHDTEAYVHRIGRTGRAGRVGNAILFVEPKEKGKLSRLQRSTNQPIEAFKQRSIHEINDQRVAKFKTRVLEAMQDKQIKFFTKLVSDMQNETDLPFNEIAGALAVLAQGESPLLLEELSRAKSNWKKERAADRPRGAMTTFRVEVGRSHGVGPGNIVGAVTNEANLTNADIGRINIFDRFSTIDLPADLSDQVIEHLADVQVSGNRLGMAKSDRSYAKQGGRRAKPAHGGRSSDRGRYSDRSSGSSNGASKFAGKREPREGGRKWEPRAERKFDKPREGAPRKFDKPNKPSGERSEFKYTDKTAGGGSSRPADKDRKFDRAGKKPNRSNASGSFRERSSERASSGGYEGKKPAFNSSSSSSKPAYKSSSKPKTKAAQRTQANRKPGAKPASPMKKYVKIRSSK